MSQRDPTFLTVDDVLQIHADQLAAVGGGAGLRDRGLLESAVAQPSATFDGSFVHDGLLSMAAAYLFHIVKNHPFVDGNKRTGLLSALVFLEVNGIAIDKPTDDLYELTLAAAEGRADKAYIASELGRIAGC